MNDTNVPSDISSVFVKDEPLSSSEVAALSLTKQSLVTVKRQLSALTKAGYLEQSGAGRSVKYKLAKKGWLLRPFDVREYLEKPPDDRLKTPHFQFDVLEAPYVELFTQSELARLEAATEKYHTNATKSDEAAHKKELMRFMVEFSWKTSQIEGNTYDLISTERLLLYGEKSPTNTEFEAQMILNQKEALEFILENIELWEKPTLSSLEMLHAIVGKKLGITKNLRKTMVGITGTNYRPLENEFQIRDALELLFKNIAGANNVYEKALMGILGLSYIQPFVDGNKRTSRLFANAILLSGNYSPISYRSVDDRAYKETCLVFYEQNSVEPFKKLFIEQYVFAANNYNIATIDS
ncbi:MAG TPA: Fic family protein [Candidatus Limnocylindria bacterium]|nr:Fic family protein [Candidatus Limnocylindria bacterium]